MFVVQRVHCRLFYWFYSLSVHNGRGTCWTSGRVDPRVFCTFQFGQATPSEVTVPVHTTVQQRVFRQSEDGYLFEPGPNDQFVVRAPKSFQSNATKKYMIAYFE